MGFRKLLEAMFAGSAQVADPQPPGAGASPPSPRPPLSTLPEVREAPQKEEAMAPAPPPLDGVVQPEATCEDSGTCGVLRVAHVYENGASGEPTAVLTLDAATCASRASFEGAVSTAGCGDAAACEARDAAGRWPRGCDEFLAFAAESGVQPSGPARVYAVPRSKRFVHATEEVGFERRLPHVGNVTLTTLALKPRLFAVEGFLTPADADALVSEALAIDDDEHRLMRSSTGPKGYNPSRMRTSDNAWLKFSETAMKLKRRAFDVLALPGYDETMSDGLQVLRYNVSKAYIAHNDYLSRPSDVPAEAMDPELGGANRLATLFLYLSDVDDGGQTVFPGSKRPDALSESQAVYLETRSLSAAVDAARLAAEIDDPKSWEHKMVDDCYSKLAVRPKKARAILYYSQHPSGRLDPFSKHGGCPVLSGTKWAANLWVWNKPMPFGSSRFEKQQKKTTTTTTQSAQTNPQEMVVNVVYDGARDDVDLFWQGTHKMGTLSPRSANPLRLNTFIGHEFVAKSPDGALVQSFKVQKGQDRYLIREKNDQAPPAPAPNQPDIKPPDI